MEESNYFEDKSFAFGIEPKHEEEFFIKEEEREGKVFVRGLPIN